MNAITLIVEQHREIDALSRALLVAPPDDRDHVLRLLGDRLEAHMEMEEKLLYPTVRTHRDAKAIEAYLHDHHDLRSSMVKLMHAGFTADPMFLEEARMAATLIYEHAHQEEEAHLLPLLEASLTSAELEDLGNEMLELYEELRETQPFRSIVPEARDHVFSRVD